MVQGQLLVGCLMEQKHPFHPEIIAKEAKDLGVQPHDLCCMCLKKIETMCFRFTGVCSELCRKDRDNDHSKNHAIIEAPIGGERRV